MNIDSFLSKLFLPPCTYDQQDIWTFKLIHVDTDLALRILSFEYKFDKST